MDLAGDPVTVLPDPLEAQGDFLPKRVLPIRWNDSRNGWITCAEARRHRIAPVPSGANILPTPYEGR